jgi:hypothetical protein
MTSSELTVDGRVGLDASEITHPGQSDENDDMAMPRGLMLAVARDMRSMETYAKMSDGERAAFLDKARHTPDGEPMQRLVREMRQGEITF